MVFIAVAILIRTVLLELRTLICQLSTVNCQHKKRPNLTGYSYICNFSKKAIAFLGVHITQTATNKSNSLEWVIWTYLVRKILFYSKTVTEEAGEMKK